RAPGAPDRFLYVPCRLRRVLWPGARGGPPARAVLDDARPAVGPRGAQRPRWHPARDRERRRAPRPRVARAAVRGGGARRDRARLGRVPARRARPRSAGRDLPILGGRRPRTPPLRSRRPLRWALP